MHSLQYAVACIAYSVPRGMHSLQYARGMHSLQYARGMHSLQYAPWHA